MRTFVTLFIMLMVGIGITANAQPISTLGNISTNGVTAAVPVYASNFTNVESFQLYIRYDQTIATPVAALGLITKGPGLTGLSGSLSWTDLAPGIIKVTWYFTDLPTCKTISGNPILFYVNFTRAAFGSTVLSFDDSDDSYCKYSCGAATYVDDPASTYYVSGSLTFINAAPVSTIANVSACPTLKVSVPVTVTGFNNVGTFSLTINYPTSNLTWDSGTNTSSFPGMTFNVQTPGTITIGGTYAAADGFSLADGSTFFTLNFTYIGGTPAITWYDDGESCEYSGPSNYGAGGYIPMTDGPSSYVNGSVTTTTVKIWTGSTSTAWEVAGNWCGGVPTSTIDALIPTTPSGGLMPLIANNIQADCKDLIIEAGATLTISSTTLTKNGSLIVHGNSSGLGKVTYDRRFRFLDDGSGEGINIYDWHYFSSPVGNVTATTSGNISNIYPWDEPLGAWGSGLGNTFKGFVSGKGYNLDQADLTSSVSFTGSVVSSTSVIATSPYNSDYVTGDYSEYLSRIARTPFGGGGWNLLGNPFTSAMSISSFLDANDGDGVTASTIKFDPNYVAVYIYDGSVLPNGQYLYRGKTTPFTDPINDDTNPANLEFGYDYVQVGQGFFVLAQKNGVNFTFDKTMQAHQIAVPLKSATAGNAVPGLKLKAKYGSSESSTVVIYQDQVTTGLDPGYDVGQLSTYPDVEIYTALVSKDNGVNFAQQALPVGDAAKSVVPVGVDAEKGGLVTFSASVRPIGNGTFYLEDKVTGTITDLSKDTYTVNLPASTAGTGRFFIHSSLTTGIQPIVTNNELGVRIWTNDHKVNIEGSVSPKATGAIYDLLGRKLLQTRLDDSQFNTITVPESLKGVYLVKVVDGERIATRKVVF